mmetsp:Transcript_91805/g.262535  ORF Transcript_91805/g.262535 Transcript_91805/m.262535 type:complete len:377 (-) Transcript_91805:135-1265(-)
MRAAVFFVLFIFTFICSLPTGSSPRRGHTPSPSSPVPCPRTVHAPSPSPAFVTSRSSFIFIAALAATGAAANSTNIFPFFTVIFFTVPLGAALNQRVASLRCCGVSNFTITAFVCRLFFFRIFTTTTLVCRCTGFVFRVFTTTTFIAAAPASFSVCLPPPLITFNFPLARSAFTCSGAAASHASSSSAFSPPPHSSAAAPASFSVCLPPPLITFNFPLARSAFTCSGAAASHAAAAPSHLVSTTTESAVSPRSRFLCSSTGAHSPSSRFLCSLVAPADAAGTIMAGSPTAGTASPPFSIITIASFTAASNAASTSSSSACTFTDIASPITSTTSPSSTELPTGRMCKSILYVPPTKRIGYRMPCASTNHASSPVGL